MKRWYKCRFCKQDTERDFGKFIFGNFVCRNCVDIIAQALNERVDSEEEIVTYQISGTQRDMACALRKLQDEMVSVRKVEK